MIALCQQRDTHSRIHTLCLTGNWRTECEDREEQKEIETETETEAAQIDRTEWDQTDRETHARHDCNM